MAANMFESILDCYFIVFLVLVVAVFSMSKLLYWLLYRKRDSSLDIIDFIRRRGFHAELHTLTTEDGYVLKLHRISDPRVGHATLTNNVTLVIHGMLSHSAHFVINSDLSAREFNKFDRTRDEESFDDSLAFSLALRGCDVWLINTRGNFFTLRHKSLHFKQPQFWDFGLDELIRHDVKSVLDYVINHTRAGKLTTQRRYATVYHSYATFR